MYWTSSRRNSAPTSFAWAPCRSSRRASADGCSRSSDSSHDTRFTPAQHAHDLQPVVEDNDVRVPPRLEHAEIRPAENPCRHRGGRADSLLERDAERVQVANGVDHRQHRAREHTVLTEWHPVGDLGLDVSELV